MMIRWTGLAPWEFELPFSGSLTSTLLEEGTPQIVFKTFAQKPEIGLDRFVCRVHSTAAQRNGLRSDVVGETTSG